MKIQQNKYNFLSGGGEMGELIRTKDWSQTLMGDTKGWPQSLLTTLSIILHSKFPMFLFWGKDFICFYNDAYRPSLGKEGKHPSILGTKGEEAWEEIWPIIKPLLDQVLSGGESTWSEDQLIPIYRNGRMEDVYWTFSYSPVYDETGSPAGVFVTCSETTEKVMTVKELEKSKNELEFAIEAAELGTFDYDPFTNTFSANNRLKNWFGLKDKDVIELEDAVKVISEKDRQRVIDGIQASLRYDSGGDYDIEYAIVHPIAKKEIIVKAKGKTTFTEDQVAYRFNGTLQDITEDKKAQEEIRLSESNLRRMILQAPVAIGILRGSDYIVEILNIKAVEILGRKEKELLNKPIFNSIQELASQGIKVLLDNVYKTGKRFAATELPMQFLKQEVMETVYINLSFEPLYERDGKIRGIMAIGVDVTDQVIARKKIEANEEKLNIIIDASDLAIWELDLKTSEVHYSDRYTEILGHPKGEILTHQQILQHLHTEDLHIRAEAFKKAFETGVLQYQSRIIWEDNTIHWIEGKGKVFFDNQHTPERMLGTVRDITEERLFQQQLQEREQKFRLLADSMPQFVWTSDPEGNLNYFNQSVYDYSGLTVTQIQEHGWIQIVHPEDREENIRIWVDAITTGDDFLFEHRFRRFDGEYRWQLSRAIPQKDENGTIQMWVGTSTDIQDQKVFATELERQVFERTQELEQKNIDLEKTNKELE